MSNINTPSNDAPVKPRARRGGGLRKHGTGWQARVCVNGNQVSKTLPTYKEAALWLAMSRGDLLADTGGGYEKARKMTVADLLLAYEQHGIEELRGAQQNRSRLRCLSELEWSKTALLDLMPADIDALMQSFKVAGPRGTPLADNSRRLYFAAISSAFNYAIRKLGWHFLANPCLAATKPKPGKPRKRILRGDEEDQIVKRLKASPSPYYLYVFLLLIATTMRVGELFSVRWRDVDLDNSVIDLQRDKANGVAGRVVPLSAEAVALLESMPREDGRLLPIQRAAFVSLWNQLRKELNITDLRLHDLRHDGATRWGKRLKSIVLLQQVTGHKSLSSVQRYLNVPLADTIAAMNAALVDDPYVNSRARPAPLPPQHSLVQHIAQSHEQT